MGSGGLDVERTPRFGYTDYAAGWLFLHIVALPVAIILAFEPAPGPGFALPFALGFLLAPLYARGIVHRALVNSRFYRVWLVTTVAVVLLVAIPGARGKLPAETFNSWLLLALVIAGAILYAGWFRRIRGCL
jgi:hypothetical protein